jgi:hypothetical protein
MKMKDVDLFIKFFARGWRTKQIGKREGEVYV